MQGVGVSVQSGCNLVLNGYSSTVNNYIRDGHDFQPDQYNFNLGNHAGKFILKRNKEALLEKKKKLKIVCLDASANAWEITEADGTVYSFQEYETFTDNEASSAGPPGTYKTAWYLTKITSPKGAEVNFYYTTVAGNYVKPIGSITETQNPNVFKWNDPSICGGGAGTTLYPTSIRSTPGKDYKNIYLNKITFQDGEVRFVYASDRLDITNDVRLTKVQIYRNTYNPTATTLFKEWELTHGYFEGTADQDYNGGGTGNISKRLKLASIREKDASANALTPYIFKYDREDPIYISSNPAKTSYARDHWGYYNSKLNNTSLVPTFNTLNSSNIVDFYLGVMGEQRNPDPNYTQLFMLTEMQYPTGGKTVFEYEQNDFDYDESKKYDQSYFANFPEPKEIVIYRIYPGNVYGDQPLPAELPAKTLDLTNLYIAPGAPTSDVKIEAFFRYYNWESTDCTPIGFGNQVYYTLTTESGAVIEGPIDPIASQSSVCQPAPPAAGPWIGFKIVRTIPLTPGKYIWKIHINNGVSWLADVNLNVKYTSNSAGDVLNNGGQNLTRAGFAGGVRVKRILTYDNTTTVSPIIKRYVYNYLAADGKYYSSGVRMIKPVYSYFQKQAKVEICPPPGPQDAHLSHNQHLMRESDSYTPINGSGGNSHIGYSRVFELSGDNGEFGKTEYQYENQADRLYKYAAYDHIDNYMEYIPIRPPINSAIANPGNGNLLRKIDYRFKNNSYEKVAETINTFWNFIGTTPAWMGVEKRAIASQGVNDPCYYLNFIYPAVVENRNLLTSTTSIVYDLNDPGKSVSTTTSYTYDHSTHLQLKTTAQTVSRGNTKVTDLTYPADYSDANAGTVVADMKNTRHMHSAVITTKTKLNNSTSSQLVSGMINKYQVVNSKVLNHETALLELAQPVLPASIPDYLPVSGSTYPTSYAAKLLFEAYDIANNISQMRKKDDIPLSYIWDYNKSYPVAEVTNALQQDVAFTSFEADGTGNWTVPSTTRDNTTAITGSRSYSLASGSITKSSLTSGKGYVVSYWSKSGAYSISGATVTITRQGRVANGWTFYESEITATSTTITVSGSGLIDELRCYPQGSLMNTYTYTPVIGISTQCDPANKINYYEYDSFGRLLLIRDQDRNVVKTFEYKYKL